MTNGPSQVHILDIEYFTYLNRALEFPISPIVMLASNRGKCIIRGTEDIVAAHDIPLNLLARILIIPTNTYTPDEIKHIIRIRTRTEGLVITELALNKIFEHGVKVSLRYALQLLTPANIPARVNQKKGIDVDDVAECEDLFIDARRSASIVNAEDGFIS